MSEKTNSPVPSSGQADILIEELACAIANAQAALLAGRFEDLEHCTSRMQSLCASLKFTQQDLTEQSSGRTGIRIVADARRVQQQNRVFAAVLRRMRRHLEALRNLLNGPSHWYQPQSMSVPEHRK